MLRLGYWSLIICFSPVCRAITIEESIFKNHFLPKWILIPQKQAVIFSKGLFFQNQIVISWATQSGIMQVQLNRYVTAPNFIQLNQNLTSDCWFNWISRFLPVLAWCDHKIVLICRTILWSHHARTGKNREIQLNQQTIQCQVLV